MLQYHKKRPRNEESILKIINCPDFWLLNSITNVVTNLKPLSSHNKSISLLMTADSVSLSCSSGLKEFKISTL